MTERILEPEWLDELPDTEARAIASRRDLRRLNVFMNHAGLIARALRSFPQPKRILDIGAGDGSFTLRLAKAAGWNKIDVVLLDRAATIPGSVCEGFRALGCNLTAVQSDVVQGFEQIGAVDCVMANLFLHHFAAPELTRLLGHVAACSCIFVACEPRRSALALGASRLVGLIGCNDVTRHDAVASVRAGFRGQEISAHWPARERWLLKEQVAGLFSHLFIAKKL
jgi:hypothetical protein